MSQLLESAQPKVTLHKRKVRTALLGFAGLLGAGFVATHLLKLQGYSGQLGLRRLLNMDAEATLQAWFSSSLMLAAAGLLALIAASTGPNHGYRRHWWGLAFGFLYLSADEASSIHENLNRVALTLGVKNEGVLHWPWVALGLAIVLVLAVVYMRFLAHLPVTTRVRFVVAGTCFVAGAIGVEMATAALADSLRLEEQPVGWEERGDFPLSFMFLVLIEETLEMLGVILFIDALLGYLDASTGPVRIEVTRADQA